MNIIFRSLIYFGMFFGMFLLYLELLKFAGAINPDLGFVSSAAYYTEEPPSSNAHTSSGTCIAPPTARATLSRHSSAALAYGATWVAENDIN